MAQYIKKSSIVAEIDRRLNYRVKSIKAMNNGTYWKEEQSENEFNELLSRYAFNVVKNELFELKCFLETLEVKEIQEVKKEGYWENKYKEVLEQFKARIGE